MKHNKQFDLLISLAGSVNNLMRLSLKEKPRKGKDMKMVKEVNKIMSNSEVTRIRSIVRKLKVIT